ncbi:M23 family metallopeptidase [Helicobacter sp. MIT 05-5294]|uniref:M23 family metallopeptidase n=1 Tax=Helicobacter sp. MIT 05-5294 TaxID=1548150 RepID=UPI0010FE4097|nr:M23 family metallopeptidase [Helicobacter sp. MIT 05-5294]TLD85515.1 M23 family metallopeptidase [Helicobacter sp. MIT 05-5294]
MQNPRAKGGFAKILGLVALVIIIIFGMFMLSSDSFEKESPTINLQSNSWNLKGTFPIEISDNAGIKSYQVALIENGQRIPIDAQQLTEQDSMCAIKNANTAPLTQNITAQSPIKSFCIGIQKPQSLKNNVPSISLEVSVTDTSKWNFFKGNTTTEQFHIQIDTKKPQIAIVANSYKITQGGSALVIFKAEDENLKSVKITNGILDFTPQPFYKEGFYISLLAWSKLHEDFNAKIIAQDNAGNISIAPINYFKQKKQYRDSTIPLSDAFIDGKISSLVEEIGERNLEDFDSKLAIFRYINEEVREETFNRIFKASSFVDTESLIEDFSIAAFSPLKNGAVMASFGDHRTFTYQGKNVSESNHMGLDLASIKQAPVILNNPGVVTLNEFVGIDGNALVIYHGLGLSTLYAHLTSSEVNVGDSLARGTFIANTGNTGLALGDHLHFSVLVQGYEVWNAEWMDSSWIKTNITQVIAQAKDIINKL